MPLRQPQQYSPHTSSPSQLLIRASIVGGEPEDTLQQATLSATLPEFFNSLSPAFPSRWAKLNFFIPRYSFIHSFTNEGIFFFQSLWCRVGVGLLRQLKAQSQEFCAGQRSGGRTVSGIQDLWERKTLGLVTVRPCPRGV